MEDDVNIKEQKVGSFFQTVFTDYVDGMEGVREP